MRSETKKSKTGKAKYSGKYALTEKMICGSCGFPYRRTMWILKGEHVDVWRCTNRMDGRKNCSKSETVYEDKLHEAIVIGLNQVISKEVLAEALKESVYALDGQHAGFNEEICIMLDNLPALREYDDKYVRQLIDSVKVIGFDRLHIAFKDGIEVEVEHGLNGKYERLRLL